MENVIACRVCLITDVKMVGMELTALDKAYLQLTGLKSNNSLNTVCYECAAMLCKCVKFRDKCMRANTVLLEVLKKQHTITKETIKKIDRHFHKLESQIKIHKNKQINLNENILIKTVNNDDDNSIGSVKVELDKNSGIKTEINVNINENHDFESICDLSNGESSSDDSCFLIAIKKNERNKKKTKRKYQNITGFKNNIITEFSSQPKRNKTNYKLIENNEIKKDFELIQVGFTENIDISNSDDANLEGHSIKNKKVEKSASKQQRDHINLKNNFSAKQRTKVKKNKVNENDDITTKRIGRKFNEDYFIDYADVVNLTPEMAKQEVLIRKGSNNYIHSKLKCDLCFRGFEAEKTYKNHLKKHTDKYGMFECEYCHLRFPDTKFLWKHVYSCHKRKFSCKLCPYACFCANQARLHVGMHKGKKYDCKLCGDSFSMPNTLIMHKRIKHPTECVCPLCGSTFVTTRGLQAHTLLVHRQEQNKKEGPTCAECDVVFSTETAWKRHLVLSARHNVSNGCDRCGETFPDQLQLRKHQRVHARKQVSRPQLFLPAACPMCNKMLSSRSEYRSHMTSEHPTSAECRRVLSQDNPSVCETCGKIMKQCFLVYHQRQHTGERPHPCGECGKSFSCPAALRSHGAVHLPASPHGCHLCQKTYKSRSALLKHLRAHSGIRPFKCKVCEKSFPHPCDVRLHMQFVHHKVPWPKRDRSRRKNKINTETSPVFN